MTTKHRLLVVDDEAGMRELLEIVFSSEYDVTLCEDVESAIKSLESRTADVVITDLRIGNEREAGLRMLSWLHENASMTPAIMMTAHGSVETAIQAMKHGAEDYILKPFTNDEIRLLVQRAIEQRDLRRANTAYKADQARHGSVDNMVGTSTAINEVRDMIRRVSTLPSTIAIYGESGTGKELVARSIHQLSERREKPFVAINCGGIPENLLESELFGHTKGAFTGAVADKEGLFVSADGGTLFLDEIGEMPLALQVKLLRVLDNNTVMPLGGTRIIDVDVRLISATNRDLSEMVRTGTFREDLYYRLNVIPMEVPPLRERMDDIPLLARHFVHEHATNLNRPEPHLTDDVIERLTGYSWPGNVRELRNAMERAVALARDNAISVNDLPQDLASTATDGPQTELTLPPGGIDIESVTETMERSLIQQALERAHYSQKNAAKLLKLTPRSLRYRLQKYGMKGD